uniref:Uncharacterized protein n=1 Tax=Cajanus cajan TaxID=3821 RepID=A0A151RB41_CAJCA|nr:hypothetical protein KK1_038909 [Cajanus cajan]
MYYRKIAAHIGNEKLLIHYFQKSLFDVGMEKVVDKIPTTHAKLLPQLLEASMLVRLSPLKKFDPPYPTWYRPKEWCDYHSSSPEHSTEHCKALELHVQGFIDVRWLMFHTNTPSIDK